MTKDVPARWEHFAHDADIGVRGFGLTMAEAFEQAALALTAIVTDAPVASVQEVSVSCRRGDPALLFVAWLDAVIFEMATRKMLFGSFAVDIDGEAPGAYNDVNAVVLAAEQAGHASRVARLRPLICIKG